jgi:hypothetical protein
MKKNFYYLMNIFLISMSISMFASHKEMSASDKEMSASDKEIAREYLNKLYLNIHDLTTSNEHIPEESSADIPEQPSSDISEEQPTHIPEEPRANMPKSPVVIKNNYFTAPIQNSIEGKNADNFTAPIQNPIKDDPPNIPLPEHSMLRANREDSTDSTDSDAAFGESAVAAGDTSLELPISDSMPSKLAVNLSALSLGALGISSSALAAIGAKILLSSALLPFAPYITVAIIISEIGTVTVAATSFFLSGYLLAAYWHYSNDLTANESFNNGGIIEI